MQYIPEAKSLVTPYRTKTYSILINNYWTQKINNRICYGVGMWTILLFMGTFLPRKADGSITMIKLALYFVWSECSGQVS